MDKIELDGFVCLVSMVRKAQKDYFRLRTSEALNESKRLEKVLDVIINSYFQSEKKKHQPEFWGKNG
ncbi:MAG: hypothetical protein LBJ41_01750 [Treponema sp.]|nr:hypothetical protein [Treponema sp.]